jgi:hypothetical protein
MRARPAGGMAETPRACPPIRDAAMFRVSAEADALANTQDFDACRKSMLPYGKTVRTCKLTWWQLITRIAQSGLTRSKGAMGNSTLARSGP